jgi:single-strand DNA-binding protein
MIELNKVLLVGRLTRDPDYRSTSSGKAVAQLGLAVNRRMSNRETGGYQDETMFIDADAWDRQAEFCKNYLHKGSGVFIEGRLRQDNWQDKETGQNRSKLKVTVERISFAESKAEAERHSGGGGSGSGGGNYGGGAPAQRNQDSRPEPVYDGDSGGGGETHDDLPF